MTVLHSVDFFHQVIRLLLLNPGCPRRRFRNIIMIFMRL